MPTSAHTGSTPGTINFSTGRLKPLKFKLEVDSSGGCRTTDGAGDDEQLTEDAGD